MNVRINVYVKIYKLQLKKCYGRFPTIHGIKNMSTNVNVEHVFVKYVKWK